MKKTVIKIAFAFVALVIAILVSALFVDRQYSIVREVTINRPKAEVFGYTRLLKNQDYYNKWVMRDKTMKKNYSGTDGTAGFTYSWKSDNDEVGEGFQQIQLIKDGERRVDVINFIKPIEGIANTYMDTDSLTPNSTRVKWGFSSSMPYPMNIVRLFVSFEDVLGKDMEESLGNLKNQLEKKQISKQ